MPVYVIWERSGPFFSRLIFLSTEAGNDLLMSKSASQVVSIHYIPGDNKGFCFPFMACINKHEEISLRHLWVCLHPQVR